MLLANVIDSFRKGLFLPSYMRTLEGAFGEGNVHLVTTDTEYNDMGTGTYVVLAGSQLSDTRSFMSGDDEPRRLCHIMPQELLHGYLTERSPIILRDDYVPVDNLIAPVFEERFGYRR